jgi:hypothetical protein
VFELGGVLYQGHPEPIVHKRKTAISLSALAPVLPPQKTSQNGGA